LEVSVNGELIHSKKVSKACPAGRMRDEVGINKFNIFQGLQQELKDEFGADVDVVSHSTTTMNFLSRSCDPLCALLIVWGGDAWHYRMVGSFSERGTDPLQEGEQSMSSG
jgi:hypothetical protein